MHEIWHISYPKKDCACISSKILFDEKLGRYFEIHISLVDTFLNNLYENRISKP